MWNRENGENSKNRQDVQLSKETALQGALVLAKEEG